MSIDREKLRELEKAATKGPWARVPHGVDSIMRADAETKGDFIIQGDFLTAEEEDLEIIVAARNNLIPLLDEADARDKQLAELEAERNEAETKCNENADEIKRLAVEIVGLRGQVAHLNDAVSQQGFALNEKDALLAGYRQSTINHRFYCRNAGTSTGDGRCPLCREYDNSAPPKEPDNEA